MRVPILRHSFSFIHQAGLAKYWQNKIAVESSWDLLVRSRHTESTCTGVQTVMYAEAGEGTGEARLVFAFVARGPSGHALRRGAGRVVPPLGQWWKIRQVATQKLSQFSTWIKSGWGGKEFFCFLIWEIVNLILQMYFVQANMNYWKYKEPYQIKRLSQTLKRGRCVLVVWHQLW